MDHNKLALPVGTTLDRFIMRKQEDFPYATGELSQNREPRNQPLGPH
jgi:fructose-1,6-bisphosphatase I